MSIVVDGGHETGLRAAGADPGGRDGASLVSLRYGQRISKGVSMTLASAGARPDASSPL